MQNVPEVYQKHDLIALARYASMTSVLLTSVFCMAARQSLLHLPMAGSYLAYAAFAGLKFSLAPLSSRRITVCLQKVISAWLVTRPVAGVVVSFVQHS